MGKQNQQDIFKQIMGSYPTGVTIITTTKEDGTPLGMTVNSFASVSLDPLLVLWSIDHGVSSLNEFIEGGKFAVHVLNEDQVDLCKVFAGKHEDRFSVCDWRFSENGLPIIEDAFGVLECETFKTIKAGDHTTLIGEVTNLEIKQEKEPMLYHRRVFGAIPEEFYKQKTS